MFEEIKARAFARGQRINDAYDIKKMLIGKALFNENPPYAHNLRRAAIDRAIFEEYPIEIDSDELLVGRFAEPRALDAEERALADAADKYVAASGMLAGTHNAYTGHRVIDYEKLLNVGVRGVLAEIDARAAEIDFSKPEDAARAAFYDAARISLTGFARFCERARARLIAEAAIAEPARREQLARMARNFERAPMEKCEHFYEAVQIMWFMQFSLCLLGDISLTGRFDNYMYPFYKKDIESGEITPDFAREIIEHMYLKHNEIYDTWPASIMVGGVDRDGKPVWNELSYMCIEAIRATGLINPSVNVSYTEDMPEDLFDLSLEIIAQGYTRPAFFNDRVIRAGLMAAGMSERDSRYYIHSTCVEITPVGCSNVQVATPYINLNTCFVPLCDEHYDNFSDFYEAVKSGVRAIIRENMISTCKSLYRFSQYASSPLASCFINDCLERGADSGNGGARYSYVYPCFPGFLNLVDSVAAVKKAVFEERVMSYSELCELLKTNFEDGERLRQYLINRCPKIGNGLDEVDKFGVELYDLIRFELKKYTTSVGASFHPSYFAWIMHGVLGKIGEATPDGRKRGAALSECLGAVQGMDKNGPTGILRSIEKLDQKYGIGGIATNIRFTKKLMNSPEGRRAVKDYIKTFMARDCFEIQFNIIDQKDLIEAKSEPEKHRTLMVRVAGYSDYFANLHPSLQNEIIARTEHAI